MKHRHSSYMLAEAAFNQTPR